MNNNHSPVFKILVVDDEQSVVELIKDYASRMDCLEFYGCSPIEALSWSKTNHFDIALIDYKMPEMNGLELLEKLKDIRSNSFFILMTLYGEKSNCLPN